MLLSNHSLVGKRVELIKTDDPKTKLRPGDQGLITYVNIQEFNDQLYVQWDKGSNLSLLIGKDEYKILDSPALEVMERLEDLDLDGARR